MPEAQGKRSISAVLVGLLLLAGAFLPWRGVVDKNLNDALVGLCPGCSFYDPGAQALQTALGTSLLPELGLLLLGSLAFLASGLLKNRPRSRMLAFGGLAATALGAALLPLRLGGSLSSAAGKASELPSWAQTWVGDGGVSKMLEGSQLGLGCFLSSVGFVFGLVLALRLLGEAKEDDGRTWLTPLAERSWFFELIEDFWFFLVERKAWWMTPIVVVLIMLVVLIIVSEKAAVLPFIYTLF